MNFLNKKSHWTKIKGYRSDEIGLKPKNDSIQKFMHESQSKEKASIGVMDTGAAINSLKNHISAEEYILSLMRLWVRIKLCRHKLKANSQDVEESNNLHEALSKWQILSCLLGTIMTREWDDFMHILASKSSEQIILGCKCCGKVSDHEIRILTVAADIQDGDFMTAKSGLSQFLSGDDLLAAYHHLLLFIMKMKAKQVVISRDVLMALAGTDYQSRKYAH